MLVANLLWQIRTFSLGYYELNQNWVWFLDLRQELKAEFIFWKNLTQNWGSPVLFRGVELKSNSRFLNLNFKKTKIGSWFLIAIHVNKNQAWNGSHFWEWRLDLGIKFPSFIYVWNQDNSYLFIWIQNQRFFVKVKKWLTLNLRGGLH